MNASVPAGQSEPREIASRQKLTPEEVDQARQFLRQTKQMVIGATRGLSDAQWKFKAAPDRWSILEILSHVVTVQELVLGPILHQLPNAPATPSSPDCKLVDAIVIHQFPNRLTKFSAPDATRPCSQATATESLSRLNANNDRLEECLESTPDLRGHLLEAPPLKAISRGAYDRMDGYQWILASAAHVERHTKQMLEVMAEPGFPPPSLPA